MVEIEKENQIQQEPETDQDPASWAQKTLTNLEKEYKSMGDEITMLRNYLSWVSELSQEQKVAAI
jgi:hypothetical protein